MLIIETTARRTKCAYEFYFKTSFGIGLGMWNEDKKPICNQANIDVELDIGERLVWGLTISPTKETGYSISYKGEFNFLIGRVVSVENDGSFSLKIGQSILLLAGQNLPPQFRGMVTIQCVKISLFPTSV